MSMSVENITATLKSVIFKRPENGDERQTVAAMVEGRRAGEGGNPYLAARRTWNEHVGDQVASRQTWQMLGLLCLLIALAGVGGMIYIGSQSRTGVVSSGFFTTVGS